MGSMLLDQKDDFFSSRNPFKTMQIEATKKDDMTYIEKSQNLTRLATTT